jgi:hypothetical protein
MGIQQGHRGRRNADLRGNLPTHAARWTHVAAFQPPVRDTASSPSKSSPRLVIRHQRPQGEHVGLQALRLPLLVEEVERQWSTRGRVVVVPRHRDPDDNDPASWPPKAHGFLPLRLVGGLKG